MEPTLLQVLLVLFPAFMMELGNRAADGGKRFTGKLLLLCGMSMLLCTFFAFPMEQFYLFDMLILPYLIGVLYGGYRSGLLLTVLYFGIRYYMFGGGTAWYLFIALHAVLVPAAFWMRGKFARAGIAGKIRIAVSLAGLGMLTAIAGIYYRQMPVDVQLSRDFYVFLTMFAVIEWMAVALIVKLIEGTREKLRLKRELQALSQYSYEEAQKLRQLIDASPVTIVAIDRDSIITVMNDAMLAHFPQLRREDFIGKPYKMLMDAYRIDVERAFIMGALRGETFRSEVNQYYGRTFILNAFPLRNHKQEITGAVAVALEVTELFRLRKEIGNMERLSLVGQMAASITHEIRNPMAVIRGFIQLMQERNGAANNEYYRVILDELDRANVIIDDFLSLAQNRIVERKQVDMNAIVRGLDPLFAAEANYRGHLLEYRLDEKVPLLFLNDKEMKQLLLNLVRNGLEAMEEKGLLTIATRNLDNEVELRVTDIGRGLTEEAKAKLFEPFYTTKTRGTGLGLTVCYSIVERHDGTILLESQSGKGTTFIVRFRKSPQLALLQTT